MTLDRLRERVGSFLEAEAAERCAQARSARRRAGLGALHERAADLFDLERISDVQRAVSESSGLEERRARFLLQFLARGRTLCVTAAETDQRLTLEAFGTLSLDDRSLGLHEATGLIAGSPDPEFRHRVEEARLDAVADEEPVVLSLLDRRREVYEELGYGSFLDACEVLSGYDLRGLARDGARFLDETEEAYRELLDWHLPRLAGVERSAATAADALRLRAAPTYAGVFRDTGSWREEQRFLEQAGVDPLAGGRLRLEEEPALSAGRAAVCCALRIPEEVVLAHAARPGRPAHAERLEALGMALHRAWTAPDLPLELRWLGDPAVPAGMAGLFAGLLESPAYMRDRVGLARHSTRDYRRLAALLVLHRVRATVGLLQVALGWSEEPDAAAVRDRYVEAMGRATGLRHDPREASWELRLPPRTGARLRAEQLAAVLLGYLRDRFDEDWYRNPRSGPALLDLFSGGQRYLATEIAVQLTSAPLSFDAVTERVKEMLA